jgi:signal transduction histidine kinase
MADVEALLRTIEELRTSRARLLESAHRDRRRLERDLHDGAQQRLFAIQIRLDAARESAAGEAELARLQELANDVSAAVDDLRALANGIYPATLAERGLVAALRAIPVEVVDKDSPRCSPVVEEAVYFTALEAIERAGRGTRPTVRLEPSPDGLAFAVEADGPGLAVDAAALTTMRDRIAAVGGELELVSSAGGRAVRGRVPLGS